MQPGRHVVDAVGGQQPPGVLAQHRDLVGDADGERVDPVVRHPADIGVDRLGGQFDALGVQRRQRRRHLHGPPRGLGRHIRVQLGVRGEAPGAVDDDPHRQADLAVDDRGFQLAVAQLHDLRRDAVNTQVGVACPGGDRRGQRSVGEVMSRQPEEVGIDSAGRCHATTVVAAPAVRL